MVPQVPGLREVALGFVVQGDRVATAIRVHVGHQEDADVAIVVSAAVHQEDAVVSIVVPAVGLQEDVVVSIVVFAAGHRSDFAGGVAEENC